MKNIKIYADMSKIEQSALSQFYDAMKESFSVKGALMPDTHTGYSLPIGAVVATKGVVVPAWVGYDLGCGLGSIKTNIKKEELMSYDLVDIQQKLYEAIPVGNNVHKEARVWKLPPHTMVAANIYEQRKGTVQLGTLGGGFGK